MKRLKVLLISLLILCLFSVSAYADSALPYQNYTYSEKGGKIVLGPDAFIPEAVIYGADLGISAMKTPTDIETDTNGNIYVLDGDNDRIVIMDSNIKLIATITGFVNEGVTDTFLNAQGLFVDEDYIYIADTERSRIIILDISTHELVKVVNAPVSSVLGKNFIFKPISLVADSDKLLYVIGEGVYEGIITIDWDSNFAGFIGSNSVTPSLFDRFWLNFATVTQRKTMVQYVPQDFSSIDIDKDGFYFVTTSTYASGNAMVKRLNPGGANVLTNLSSVNMIGDPGYYWSGEAVGSSSFVDVAAGNNKIFACLDYKRNKVFVYNEDGYLLFTFGGISAQDGGFSKPVAVTWLDNNRFAVLDGDRGSITVFKPTDYALAIFDGVKAQADLEYDLAFEKWQTVLSLNSGFELAHIQSGKTYLNMGEYSKAMQEFKLGHNKTLYSKAMAKYRAEWIRNNITTIFIIVLALVALVFARKFILFIKKLSKKRAKK